MRLIGSFQTITTQGRSCSIWSAPPGRSTTSTFSGASVDDMPTLSPSAQPLQPDPG
jgi:hypothetical protein